MILQGENASYQINDKNGLESKLNQLDPYKNPFYILQLENGDFMQIAGSTSRLTVEVRFNDNNKFKHFVLGRIPVDRTWCVIECKVGPIRVMKNEVLDVGIALLLMWEFNRTGHILDSFNKRNVTKLYTKSAR